MKTNSSPRILVTGDAGPDFDIYLHSDADNPPPGTRTAMRRSLGGAGLVQRLLEAWAAGESGTASGCHQLPPLQVAPPTFGVWHPCALGKDFADKGENQKSWRVRRSIGSGVCDADFDLPQPDAPAPLPADYNPDVVVLVDHANICRHPHGEILPHEQFWTQPNTTVVWKMSPPFCRGELWWRGVSAGVPARSIVLLSLTHLRTEPVRVSLRVSWERTALEIARELDYNPALADLRSCRDVVVTIHGEGAVWRTWKSDNRNEAEYRLIFDPAHMEGEWSQERGLVGDAYGYASVMTASLAAQLAKGGDRQTAIADALPPGLLATRLLHVLGHGPADEKSPPEFPAARLARALCDDPTAFGGLNRHPFGDFGSVEIPATKIAKPDSGWRIAATGSQGIPLHGLARRFALFGERELRTIPHARFGALLTADRREIEALRNFKTLIQTYKHGKETKPLSLAVFGPPGAGKSFGVKQIARQVLGSECEILEFNLSQFDEEELAGAFHQVRDCSLRGKMPLVFWDEFDSSEYIWLRHLLAPMNDGVFQEGQITHPLGRCIFVFAGGTCHDFRHFGPDDTANGEAHKEWRLLKGPDFKSRLHGTLDILGPNPCQIRDNAGTAPDDSEDVGFPLRRAILLRAALKLKPADRLEIDPGLLSALLETPRYTNGSRSFEKICLALHANAAGRARYLPSDLPNDAVLAMNVDDGRDEERGRVSAGVEAFKAILTRDHAFQRLAEKLAPAIHLSYIPLTERDNPNNKPYEELPPEQKADNIASALRIPWLLSLVGLELIENPGVNNALTDEEVLAILSEPHALDTLAEEEHDLWVVIKQANGWTQGLRKDDIHSHNLLVPYATLDELQKAKDRNNVLKIPEQARLAGFSIVRKRIP